jgi:hypothetical protein
MPPDTVVADSLAADTLPADTLPLGAGGEGQRRMLTLVLFATAIGILLLQLIVVAPWAGAAGGCGGGPKTA